MPSPKKHKRAPIKRLTDVPFGNETVSHHRLKNGLNVYLLEDHSAPLVSCQSWFGVGSSHERLGKTGLAHLFEHLMFKATKNRALGEFDRVLELAGAETNAATWTDWTYYYENIPKDELELALSLESDRLVNLVLSKKQIDSEREVVMNERRYTVEDDVEGTVGEALFRLAFNQHPYGWPTIGWMEDIERFSISDCRAFYKTYYAPNNCTLVIGGAINPEETLGLVHHYYGRIKPSALKRAPLTAEPTQRRERRMEMVQPTETEKLSLGYRAPAYASKDHVALTVLNEILVSGRSSRLFRRFVSDLEIASPPSGALTPFRHPGLYDFWINGRKGISAERLLSVLDDEIEGIKNRLVDEEEMEKAKNRAELSFLLSLETVSGRAEQIGFASQVTDVAHVHTRAKRQQEVTREDIRRVANKYLRPKNRSVVFVRPGDERRE